MAKYTKDLTSRFNRFKEALKGKEWRICYHELVHFGLPDEDLPAYSSRAKEIKKKEKTVINDLRKTISSVKGARAGMLRWSNKEFKPEGAKGLGYACYSKEYWKKIHSLLLSCS